jgi:hypothetical protein
VTSLQEHLSESKTAPAIPAHADVLQVRDVSAGLVQLPTGRSDDSQRSRWRLPKSLERLAGVVLFFAGWQLASSAGWLTPKVLAGPNTVVSVGWDYLKNGTLEKALWASLQRVIWGLVIGVPLAVVR